MIDDSGVDMVARKGLLTRISDFVFEYKGVIAVAIGTAISYPIFKERYETQTAIKGLPVLEQLKFYAANWQQGALSCLRMTGNYLAPYLILDFLNFFWHSANRDRLHMLFGSRKGLKKAISVQKEPVYYLKLALAEYREGDERACIQHLNDSFELIEPYRSADEGSVFAWLIEKANLLRGRKDHWLGAFVSQCEKIRSKKNKSDLEKIISAAGFALNHYELEACNMLEQVQRKDESMLLLKAQIYNTCFRGGYNFRGGQILESLLTSNKQIPFSDRPRNKLCVLKVSDENLRDRILVKTGMSNNSIQNEYQLTTIFHGLYPDLIPRPIALVRKNNRSYLLMRKVEGESFQKYFAKHGPCMSELTNIVDSIAQYQNLALVFKFKQNEELVDKLDLKFNFFRWFVISAIVRLEGEQILDTDKHGELTLYAASLVEFMNVYMKYSTGMHGDFTIDNLLRRNDGKVTIIDAERFRLGLGMYDLFNILEDTRVGLDDNQRLFLIHRFAEKQNMLRKTAKLNALLQGQYNTIFYPKQMATAVMFYDYFKTTNNPVFEDKVRHHIRRMTVDVKPVVTQDVYRLRDAGLKYFLKTELKKYVT
jgi:thiamine kinase-like enzyme